MRKETKIGIFALVTIFLAIWGFKYIQGFDILSPKHTLYATYPRVDGLRISTPVYINGMEVGLVARFFQKPDDIKTIVVEMQLDRGLNLPPNTRAEMVTTSLMGGNAINLVFEGNCTTDCLKSGAYVPGVYKGALASLASPDEVKTYMDELTKGLSRLIDTLSQRLTQSGELNNTLQDARLAIRHLRSATARMDHLLAGTSGTIERSLRNVESITGTIRQSNDQIKSIIANVEKLSGDLRDVDVKKVASETQTTIRQLQTTLASTEKAVSDLEVTLEKINTGEGALPMLLNNKHFAEELQLIAKNTDLLLRDIRLHPERYRRILSRKKIPYQFESVENDPAFKK